MASNLAEMILNNPALVQGMAQSFGLDQNAARSGMEALLPGLTRGVQREAQQAGGLEALLGALKGGSHQEYVNNPSSLGQQATREDGNAILGHILKSKDVSRNMAGYASKQSGVSSELLKQMLPVLATLVMGQLSKQTGGGGSLDSLSQYQSPARAPQSSGSTGLDLLQGFLDADRDGSVMDDVLNLAKKFL
jgi:hypothetical protein